MSNHVKITVQPVSDSFQYFSMIQWWFNEQTQLQRCLRGSCGKIPLPEKNRCIYRSKCTKTTSQEPKANDIQTQQTLFCRHTIEPQNHGFVISHARPSKDDFVSCGKGGHHLWFLFNPLRRKRFR